MENRNEKILLHYVDARQEKEEESQLEKSQVKLFLLEKTFLLYTNILQEEREREENFGGSLVSQVRRRESSSQQSFKIRSEGRSGTCLSILRQVDLLNFSPSSPSQ